MYWQEGGTLPCALSVFSLFFEKQAENSKAIKEYRLVGKHRVATTVFYILYEIVDSVRATIATGIVVPYQPSCSC